MGRAVRRLIASILELFYGPLAPLYPALTKFLFADAWQEWQRSVHRWIPAAGRVLELGCGPGDLAAFLAERGHVVIALDRSAAMARLARRRTKGAQRVQVIRADMRWLPVGDSTVDTVVTTFPTAAFLDDRTSHEIARVLREGGLLIAVLAGWPRRWPLWIRPWMPLLRGLLAGQPPESANRVPVPQHPPSLTGQVIQFEHPCGVLSIWVAEKRTARWYQAR